MGAESRQKSTRIVYVSGVFSAPFSEAPNFLTWLLLYVSLSSSSSGKTLLGQSWDEVARMCSLCRVLPAPLCRLPRFVIFSSHWLCAKGHLNQLLHWPVLSSVVQPRGLPSHTGLGGGCQRQTRDNHRQCDGCPQLRAHVAEQAQRADGRPFASLNQSRKPFTTRPRRQGLDPIFRCALTLS